MSIRRLLLIISVIIAFYFISRRSKSVHSSRTTTSITFLVVDRQSNKTILDLTGEYQALSSKQTIPTPVKKYTIENIYFLLTTNTLRTRYTINFMKFWLTSPSIHCLILFEERDLNQREWTRHHLKNNQIPCRIEQSSIQRFEERYFQLIDYAWTILHERNHSNIEWFAIGDDDTLWFIDNLLAILQQYNSSNMIYLGNTSDRNETIRNHGNYYAYGGGGILLSKALILHVANSSQICLKKYKQMFGGDEIIGKCLTEFFRINFTLNEHFHQIDHAGDLEGFFQSGIDGLVSLHHLFTMWEPFPIEHLEAEVDILNLLALAYGILKDDFLKRFVRRNYRTNQTLLLTNGYSLSIYDRLVSGEELDRIELTWNNSQFYGRKTRKKETKKIVFFFKQFYSSTTGHSAIYQYHQHQIEIHRIDHQ